MSSAPKTLNGWVGIPSYSDPRMVTHTVPGTHKSIHLRREVAPVFLSLLARINQRPDSCRSNRRPGSGHRGSILRRAEQAGAKVDTTAYGATAMRRLSATTSEGRPP
ncbi:MAG: hypothetical protein IPJ65_20930 [Archangiaceae bacterium]|nr:hypothetical protein [Archangiaceae bacterium]